MFELIAAAILAGVLFGLSVEKGLSRIWPDNDQSNSVNLS
jgi:hypothetical protein